MYTSAYAEPTIPCKRSFLEGLPMRGVLQMGCVTAFELQAQHSCDMEMPATEEHLLICRTKHKSLVRCEVEGRSVSGDTLPGELTLIPAGCSSRWSLSGPQHTVCLLIRSSVIAEASRTAIGGGTRFEQYDPCLRKASFTPDPSLHQLAVSLYQEMKSPAFAGEISIEALTRLLAVHLIRRYSNVRPDLPAASSGLPPHRLRHVLDYIAQNYTENLELADLARLVKMTPYYFLRLFKKSTGKTPHQYLLHMRIEKAKELLLADDMCLADISLELGFSNQSHFGTTFRRLTGVTPKIFQLSALCGADDGGGEGKTIAVC